MKKITGFSLAVAAALLLSSNAMALPTAGQFVKLSNGTYGTTNGGEFKVDVLGNDIAVDYISFCLEVDEHINYRTKYKIDSVADYAEAKAGYGRGVGDDGKDYLDDRTKWVFWNYIQGTFGDKNHTMANTVQNIIWFLEDEATDLGSYQGIYHDWMGMGEQNKFKINGTVKVLNLSYNNTRMQSQIIGEAAPVPEPATMLFFGTGLVGLAGIARRRKNI